MPWGGGACGRLVFSMEPPQGFCPTGSHGNHRCRMGHVTLSATCLAITTGGYSWHLGGWGRDAGLAHSAGTAPTADSDPAPMSKVAGLESQDLQ